MAFFSQTRKKTKEVSGDYGKQAFVNTLVGGLAGYLLPGSTFLTGAIGGGTGPLAGWLGEQMFGKQTQEYEEQKHMISDDKPTVGFGNQTSSYMAQLAQSSPPPKAPEPMLPGYLTQQYY